MPASCNSIALSLVPVAREAGNLVLALQKAHAPVRRKSDGTPACPADNASEALIVGRLRAAFPDIPIVSEERIRDGVTGSRFFLVDPLDGTADFVDGGHEFCVNIALIEQGRPVAAAIYEPAGGTAWLAGETAAVLRAGEDKPVAVRARRAAAPDLTILASNRYGDAATEACLDVLAPRTRLHVSSAIKFCRIAEGAADLYLRLGRTMQWDTAAGDLIVERAGGAVCGLDGKPLRYGADGSDYANRAFLALGNPGLIGAVLAACRDVPGFPVE